MKVLRYVFIFCIALFSGVVSAQDQAELFELMRSRGEYYFTVSVKAPQEAGIINRICSVDAVDGNTVVCYANQKEYDEMLNAGYKPTLMVPPSMKSTKAMWNGQGTYNWDTYLTYPQYELMMQGFTQNSGSSRVKGRTCTLLTLGTLASGRKLLGVRINNGNPNGKPKFLYTSTIHGDEITGMILLLRLINELCTSSDSRITNLVNNLDIFIFPNANPDGTYYGGDNTVNGARRYNGNYVDLNRHFPDFDDGAHPDGEEEYQDEAQWMMDLAQQYLFTMSANFHGGAEVMNYPWDTTYDLHPDDAWWNYVCTEYVSNARQVNSNYMTDTYSSGVTSGAAWYSIAGGRQDYMNYYAQCREVTIECSTVKTPLASELPNFWNYNHNSMLAYMEQCLNGIHGFVYDATSGEPVEGVTVTVVNHDYDGSAVSTHEAGDFHRPIKAGTYTLRFEKPGYEPQDVVVTIADGQRVDLTNIQFVHKDVDFTASSTTITPGESINFTDASFGTITSWSWTFEGATPSTSTVQNPTNIRYDYAGEYDVTLTVTDSEGNSNTLTKRNFIHVIETCNMHNGSATLCNDVLFYDSGASTSNYDINENLTLTFYPCSEGAKVCVDFQTFEIENNWDFLYIYDGTSTSATLIGEYTGTTSPGTVTATNASGALTFMFTSDSSITKSGWSAVLTTILPTIVLADNADNSSTISSADGIPCNVTLADRTLYKDGCWNTLCLPFTVDIAGSSLDGDGVVAKTLTAVSFNGNKLHLTFGEAVSTLQAGVPYIIKWSDSPADPTIVEPTFERVTVSNETHNFDQGSGDQRVRFIGTIDLTTFITEDRSILFLNDANKLCYPLPNAYVGACRAYFKIGEDDGKLQSKSFTIDFGDGTETTAIDEISNHQSPIENGNVYDLNGRRVSSKFKGSRVQGVQDNGQLKKGLYIINGNKIVIK